MNINRNGADSAEKIKVIPLGGLEQIGMNITASTERNNMQIDIWPEVSPMLYVK